jgi:hypothetical protein
MSINLKNYTTEVPAARSIENIEKLLASFGASNTMREYAPDQTVAALSFIVDMNGMKLPFRLPAKLPNVYKWLRKKKPNSAEKTVREQAYRIAWKTQHEWVHLQLTLIELDQAEKLELFLPYLYDVQKQETYYQKIKGGGFKALLPESK